MPHVFLPPANLKGDQFTLDSREAHHLIRVLRKKIGDSISLFDGQGRRFRGELVHIDSANNQVKGRILEKLADNNREIKFSLVQGLPRGSKFDYVIEKAVELGVDRIVPFLSEKNLLKEPSGESKQTRWKRLAEAASKQSGRSTVPSIEPAKKLSELTGLLKQGLSLLLSLDSKAAPIRSILNLAKDESPIEINVIVGPESGFSVKETTWLESLGCKPVSLGSLTLRTETAGLVALSLVNYELGLL